MGQAIKGEFMFYIIVILAAIFAMPAKAAAPDLQGIWARVSFPGFGRPLTGAGPVVMKNRGPNGRPRGAAYAGDYTNPILKPQAAEIVKRHADLELSGIHAPSPRTECWPTGVPLILANSAMQLIQQPDKITILYSETYEVRHIRMNQPHPAQVTPSWYGDSVGHYEGDTLVIDTVGIKVGPFGTTDLHAMVDQLGTPHSPALHVVERYRLLDHEAAKVIEDHNHQDNGSPPMVDNGIARDPNYKGKGLELELNVEDEGVFTMPWSASMIYWPPLVPMGQWPEITCVENANSYDGRNLAKKAPMPVADKLDF
jgi:hypothetical protein